MTFDPRYEQVRTSLHELAQPVATDLRRERMRRQGVVAANGAGRSLLLVAVVYLLVTAIAALSGADARLSWYVVVPLWLIAPAFLVIRQMQRAGRAKVADVGALAAIDRELQLKGRMAAAREFVDSDAPDGFMQAAIRDAERRIETARAAKPAVAGEPPRLRPSLALWAVAGLLVLLVATQFHGVPSAMTAAPRDPERVAALPDAVESEPEANAGSPRQPPATKDPQAARPAAEPQDGDAVGDDDTPSTQSRRGRNPLGSGRSAQARASQGSGSERGQPSNQAQSTKGTDPTKAKKPKPPKDQKDPKDQGEVPPKPQEQSGATQGRGSGRGSSKSPTATPWASKDQVVSDEQQEADEDEEVDDENDESEARGGVQPNLRQRKPPVNRDLQISMGGGPPNEDANGRGGPSGPKKQRGVAQLVLGVTFPDHVTAPPNPGMSKVTQERIEPQAQASDAAIGEDRGQRTAPMGHLSRRVLSPWMQDLVRQYYLSIRNNSGTE